MEGKTEMVPLLLLKGAKIDASDKERETPLYLATRCGQSTAALALVVAGADVNLGSGRFKRSVALAAAKEGLVEILRALIECGADVSAGDTKKTTPLHVAARFNKVGAISVLVEGGASINARDSAGATPLHSAPGSLRHEALLALLQHGAHVNAQDKTGETPLHGAPREGGTQGGAEVVDFLLRSSADDTILNNKGKAAADVVGVPQVALLFQEEEPLAEEIERVRGLLANAPADRAWRRRGYLVLCRAHPDRVQLVQRGARGPAGTTRSTRSGGKLAKADASGCTETARGTALDGRSSCNWAGVVAVVLGLQEDDIVRAVVGYL